MILRMCQGADNVTSLLVVCHSELNRYINAAHHYSKGKAAFCLESSDRKNAPGVLVQWVGALPESLAPSAAEVLQKVLTENFPCKGRK